MKQRTWNLISFTIIDELNINKYNLTRIKWSIFYIYFEKGALRGFDFF